MLAEHYKTIQGKSESAFDHLCQDSEKFRRFTAAHNDHDELESLLELSLGRAEEQIFKLAFLEYQHALYSFAFAQYRQAHISLRLFLELSLSGIMFSAHEIDAHLWHKGQKDSNWSSLISKDNGVLSKAFIGAFFDALKEYSGEYHAMAAAVYRECSEYVHGNRSSFEGIDADIRFKDEIADAWLERADTVRMIIKFAFLARYLNHAEHSVRNKIQDIALENFGSLPPIQGIYAGAVA